MSRAFVREQDNEAVEELPDRPVSEHPNDVTAEGAARIDAELRSARAAYAAAHGKRRPRVPRVSLPGYALLVRAAIDRAHYPAARGSRAGSLWRQGHDRAG